MTWELSPAIASIAAALIAAFVGFMSIVISKEQKVSEFRQTWINALRDDLAEAISAASTLTSILQEAEPDSGCRLREWGRLTAALARVELRLNRTEVPHQKLIQCIRSAERLISRLDEDNDDYDQKEWLDLQKKVVKDSQDLLKIEWQIVKKGEPFYKIVKSALVTAVVLGLIFVLLDRIRSPVVTNSAVPQLPKSSPPASASPAAASPPD